MKNDFFDFKFPHFVTVLAAGMCVRLLWRLFERGSSDDLLSSIQNKSPGGAPWVHVERYRPGKAGVLRTLQAMRALVRRSAGDPYIRQAAHAIVRRCAGHQFNCEVEAIFQFVRDRITYRRDPAGYEWVQDAQRTLQLGFGDCDDKSVLLASLLCALGHRSRFVVLGYQPGAYSHVYVEAWDSRQWLALDPTNEHAPVGWQGRAIARGVYEIFEGRS